VEALLPGWNDRTARPLQGANGPRAQVCPVLDAFVCQYQDMVQAWSLLTIDAAELQFGGNLGYEDVLGDKYVWNNTVPNSGAVRPGDLVVLRDRRWVLGLAWVDDILTGPGRKVQRRCPGCSSTAIKGRRTLKPEYKCSGCRAEFPEPVSEVRDVTVFEADYSRTWRSLVPLVPVERIRQCFLNSSGQQSIRPLAFEATQAALAGSSCLGPLWWKEDGGVRPSISGGHKLVLHKARIGQQQFRQAMLRRFGAFCAITGTQPEETLEAAHLYRYADNPHHDPTGGLLLRRDLHALLDRGLLAIDTRTWTVRTAPRLHAFADLASLEGRPLTISAELRPKAHYLHEHHRISIETW
jgi:HNH endonuclease